MATNKLTDALCRKGIPGKALPYKLSDGGGLFLYVSATGSKSWRLPFKDSDGKEQTKTFGSYSILSLADARIMRDAFKRDRLMGVAVKPSIVKSISFRDAYTRYWNSRRDDIAPKTCQNALRAIEMYLGKLDARQVRSINKTEVLECLMVLDAQKKFVYARKVRGWVSQVFRWAIAQEYSDEDPADSINPRYTFGRKPVEHFASLTMSELPAFLDRLGFEQELQSVLACRVMAYTWVRTKELRSMRWDQIEGDVWRVPAAVMKLKREHLVPLSRQVQELLEKLKMRSRGSPYVFPNDRDPQRPMSENSVLYLIGRIGYKGLMTGHGWRHVVSTWANEQVNEDHTKKFDKDWVEMQLAHTDENKVRSTYNSAEYLPQRRRMLAAWADHLDKIDPRRAQG